jgi:hypothetical protein
MGSYILHILLIFLLNQEFISHLMRRVIHAVCLNPSVYRNQVAEKSTYQEGHFNSNWFSKYLKDLF